MYRFKHLSALLLIGACALTLGACSSSVGHYYPGSGGYSKSKLPSGHGGHRKIGKPYTISGKTYYPLSSAAGYDATGTGSWYGRDFHGKKTANGERYDMHAMSAAHKTLPLPTMVRVTNLENGKSIVVRVNDRGPFVKNRIIDLSYAAARALDYDRKGTARVRVQALEGASGYASRRPETQAISPKPILPPAPVEPAPEKLRVASEKLVPGMYIQLGAFGSATNADRLRSTLAADFPSVRVQPYMSQMRRLYRVRIGPYSDVRNIESNVLRLEQQGYHDAIVVIE